MSDDENWMIKHILKQAYGWLTEGVDCEVTLTRQRGNIMAQRKVTTPKIEDASGKT